MLAPFFVFNDTATTEIYTLSLHDALPICAQNFPNRFTKKQHANLSKATSVRLKTLAQCLVTGSEWRRTMSERSEEHTSELQSRQYLVCRLLLEKKKSTSPCTTL